MGLTKKLRLEFVLEFQHYVVQYDFFWNNLALSSTRNFYVCRLSTWLLIGFSYGCFFSCRSNGNSWLLGVHVSSLGSLNIFSAGLCGSMLVDFGMSSSLVALWRHSFPVSIILGVHVIDFDDPLVVPHAFYPHILVKFRCCLKPPNWRHTKIHVRGQAPKRSHSFPKLICTPTSNSGMRYILNIFTTYVTSPYESILRLSLFSSIAKRWVNSSSKKINI